MTRFALSAVLTASSLGLCASSAQAGGTPQVLSFTVIRQNCLWNVYDPATGKETAVRTTPHCPVDLAWDVKTKTVFFLSADGLFKAQGGELQRLAYPPDFGPLPNGFEPLEQGIASSIPLLAVSGTERELRLAFTVDKELPAAPEHRILRLAPGGDWALVHASDMVNPGIDEELSLRDDGGVLSRLEPAPGSASLHERAAPARDDYYESCGGAKLDEAGKRFCAAFAASGEAQPKGWAPSIKFGVAIVRTTLSDGTVVFLPQFYDTEQAGPSYDPTTGPAFTCSGQCRTVAALGRARDYGEDPRVRARGAYFLAGNVLGMQGRDTPVRVLPVRRAKVPPVLIDEAEAAALR
ncbi:MAG: hypothetical protein HY928_05625 [Elusimicrobia bacterium]|nr:hypothetical protein [Elusimicrobiota bacterium]